MNPDAIRASARSEKWTGLACPRPASMERDNLVLNRPGDMPGGFGKSSQLLLIGIVKAIAKPTAKP